MDVSLGKERTHVATDMTAAHAGVVEQFTEMWKGIDIQYNLGNPTYMGPRYCQITKNNGLLEKVGTNLLSYTAQHRSFRIII
jgi:hypothetical protein